MTVERVKNEPVIISGKAALIETIRVNGKIVTFIDKNLSGICRNDLSESEQKAAQDFVNSILKIQKTIL